jgi:acyl-CoA synthetase (AMP-forming)/AMP-acid ligase II
VSNVHGRPELPYQPTVPTVLRRAARQFGADDLVVLPDRRISHAQAEESSRHLAKQLLAAGVGKGSRVGIHLSTSTQWAVAFLAAARIGALVMPFSTLYRPLELGEAIRTSDICMLVSSTMLLGKDHESFLEEALPALVDCSTDSLRMPTHPYLRSVRLLGPSSRTWAGRLDIETGQDTTEVFAGFDDAMLAAVEAEVSAADPVLAVLTSGTSAEPKAVVHTHGAVIRKTSPVANAALNAPFGGRVLSLMPFFWVGGMQELLGALQSGAAVVTLERLDAEAALALGRREKVTSVMGNPQAIQALPDGGEALRSLPTLRPLPARPWAGPPNSLGVTPVPIGMTETFGPWSSVEGLECRIVDEVTGADCGEGEVGELLVRGYALMAGIYKQEREDTFTDDGYYRTGDLGYVEGDRYFFAARLKDLIKTKGANVAPPEVEAVLNSHPDVQMAFVVGLPHATFGEEVVAGVVAADGVVLDVDELQELCRRRLSSYKVPRHVEMLAASQITYLASGKPDRRAVKELIAVQRLRIAAP